MTFGKILSTALLATMALLSLNGVASAQTKQKHKDWQVICRDDAAPGQIKCFMSQSIQADGSGVPLLNAIIVKKDTDPNPTITFNFPGPVVPEAGVSIKVDRNKPYGVRIDKCMKSGCLATANLKGPVLDQMKKGQGALIVYTLPTEKGPQQVGVMLSLIGFTSGLSDLLERS